MKASNHEFGFTFNHIRAYIIILCLCTIFGSHTSIFAEKTTDKDQKDSDEKIGILEKQIRFAALTQRLEGFKKIIKLDKDKHSTFIPILEELALKDPDASIRITSIKTLGRIKSKSSEECLIKSLEDLNESVVRESVNALRLIESKKAGAPLMEILKKLDSTKNDQLYVSIVNYLASIPYKDGADTLLTTLKDSATHQEIKRTIIVYFGKAGILSMKSELEMLMADENADMGTRTYAANSLGHLGDKSAVSSLKKELDKIEKIPDSKTRANFNRFKSSITLALLRLGDKSAVPYVLAQLRDDDPKKRMTAANRVSAMQIEGGKEHLEYMAKYDHDYKVKKNAQRALENWGKKKKK